MSLFVKKGLHSFKGSCYPARHQAAVAQLVEHIIRNDGVGGSSPFSGTKFQSKHSQRHAKNRTM